MAMSTGIGDVKFTDLGCVLTGYVSLSTCSRVFISIKLVFTVCSNDARNGEQQRLRNECVCVCVCASDNMTVFESFYFQQKSVSIVKVSLNVLVNCRALERM